MSKKSEQFRTCRTVANAIMIIANETTASPESILELIQEKIGCDKSDIDLIKSHFLHQQSSDLCDYLFNNLKND